jgi:hypothetical protein
MTSIKDIDGTDEAARPKNAKTATLAAAWLWRE